MNREDDRVVRQAILSYHCALVGNSGITEESFKTAQQNAKDSVYDILGSIRPWDGHDSKERRAKEMADMEMAWYNAFGVDPDDPDWEAKVEQEMKEFTEEFQRAEANAPEAAYDRIQRKRHERQGQQHIRDEISKHKVWQGS